MRRLARRLATLLRTAQKSQRPDRTPRPPPSRSKIAPRLLVRHVIIESVEREAMRRLWDSASMSGMMPALSAPQGAPGPYQSSRTWVCGTSSAPVRLQARIAPGQAQYSTYASRMRAGTSTLMQPIQRSARDPETLLGSRTSRHVYYAEDEDDEDDEDDAEEPDEDDLDDDDDEYNDAGSDDEEYGVQHRPKRRRGETRSRSPVDPEAEAELLPPGQQLGRPVPSHRLVVRPAKRTPHTYFTERQLEQQGDSTEVLVPIRIEFHTETHRIKDVFLWNLHEQLISPYQFAHIFLQDLELPMQPYATQIESLIIQQLSDAMSALDSAGDGHERLIHLKTVARDRERKRLEIEAEQRRRAAQPMVLDSATSMPRKRGRPRKYPLPEPPAEALEAPPAPIPPEPIYVPPSEADEAKATDKTRIHDTLAKVDAEDDLRVMVEYEVQMARYMLRDRLEWDLCSTLTPETFAQTLVRDLGLPLEGGMLISHALHEQLLHHRRAAMELGLFGTGKMYKCTMDELLQIEEAEAAGPPQEADEWSEDAVVAMSMRDDQAPPHTRSRRMAAAAVQASALASSAGTGTLPFLVPDTTLPLPVRRRQALATLHDLLAMGPRPLEGAWRDYADTLDFGPVLEYLSEAEVEKMEEVDLRATRRNRRDAQRLGRGRR